VKQSIVIIGSICAVHWVCISTVAALPPQVAALNDLMSDGKLARLPYSMEAVFDKSANLHVFYRSSIGDLSDTYNYLCLDPAGFLKMPSKVIIPAGDIFESFADFRMEVDNDKNIHVLLSNAVSGPKDKYILLDSLGNVHQELYFKPFGKVKSFHVIQDSLIVGFRIGRLEALGDRFQIFYLKTIAGTEFRTLSLPVLSSPTDYRNEYSDFFTTPEGQLVMVGKGTDNWGAKKVYFYKYQVDLEQAISTNYSVWDARQSASIIYSNCRADINLGNPSIISLGDTVIYFMRQTWGDPQRREVSDSLFVYLMDKNGNLINLESQECRQVTYQDLGEALPGDRICKANWDPPKWATTTGPLITFGIFSFRDFPDLIIDVGDE
jgi:hypothetical protein